MNGWFSKEDIINDISQITGTAYGFDDEFISRGPRPPPPRRMDNESDEIELMFGKQAHKAPVDVIAPDLSGITALIRQVSSDGANNNSDSFDELNKKTQIEITKLNPNVAEFVPKSTITVVNQTASNQEKRTSPINDKENTNTTSDKENDTDNIDLHSSEMANSKCDIVTQQNNMTSEKLKNRILEKSDSKNLKDKKEKNVALAALLKLFTAPKPVSDKTTPAVTPIIANERPPSPQKLVLLPPTHFEGPVVKRNEPTIPIITTPKEHNKEDIKPLLTVKGNDKPLEICDLHYDQSVKIVNDWLENSDKKQNCNNTATKRINLTPRSLHLNPISFKKKSASPQSNPSSSCSNNDIRKVPVTYEIPSYVPSKDAEELEKQLMEKAKNKDMEDDSKLDWQTKLYRDLKKKDEAIRQKKMEQSNGASSTSTD